jgi:hemerythrin-like metal-binding protein
MTDQKFPSRPAPSTGSDTIDAEHGIQLGLVDAATAALSGNTESAPELVEQLFTYTQAHFLYEQLLMRRTARPNYAGHVQEHDRLMRQLHTVRDRTRDADYAAAVAQLKAHGEDLIEHISSWDMSIE